jgi:hypothetical protein
VSSRLGVTSRSSSVAGARRLPSPTVRGTLAGWGNRDFTLGICAMSEYGSNDKSLRCHAARQSPVLVGFLQTAQWTPTGTLWLREIREKHRERRWGVHPIPQARRRNRTAPRCPTWSCWSIRGRLDPFTGLGASAPRHPANVRSTRDWGELPRFRLVITSPNRSMRPQSIVGCGTHRRLPLLVHRVEESRGSGADFFPIAPDSVYIIQADSCGPGGHRIEIRTVPNPARHVYPSNPSDG